MSPPRLSPSSPDATTPAPLRSPVECEHLCVALGTHDGVAGAPVAATRDLAPNASLWPEDRRVATTRCCGQSLLTVQSGSRRLRRRRRRRPRRPDVAANAAAAATATPPRPAGTVVAVAAAPPAVGVPLSPPTPPTTTRCAEAGRVPLPSYVACRELHRGACDLLTLGGVQKPCVPARGAAGSCVAGRTSECAASGSRWRHPVGAASSSGAGGGAAGAVGAAAAAASGYIRRGGGGSCTRLYQALRRMRLRASACPSLGKNETDKRVMDCERWCFL